MKKQPKFLAFYILFALLFACQNKEKSIAKKWMVYKVDIAGTTLTEDMVYGFYFDISPTGSYKIKGMNEETGNWKIKNDSIQTVEDKRGRSISYYIRKLSEDTLILVDNSLETNTTTTFVSSPN